MLGTGCIYHTDSAEHPLCAAALQIVVVGKMRIFVDTVVITDDCAEVEPLAVLRCFGCRNSTGHEVVHDPAEIAGLAQAIDQAVLCAENAADIVCAGDTAVHLAVINCNSRRIGRTADAPAGSAVAGAYNAARALSGSDQLAVERAVPNVENAHGLSLIGNNAADSVHTVDGAVVHAVLNPTVEFSCETANPALLPVIADYYTFFNRAVADDNGQVAVAADKAGFQRPGAGFQCDVFNCAANANRIVVHKAAALDLLTIDVQIADDAVLWISDQTFSASRNRQRMSITIKKSAKRNSRTTRFTCGNIAGSGAERHPVFRKRQVIFHPEILPGEAVFAVCMQHERGQILLRPEQIRVCLGSAAGKCPFAFRDRDRNVDIHTQICNCKFSKKQHAQPRALLFTKRAEPGQSRASSSALYRRQGEKSTSIFAFPPHFPPAEAAKRRCVRLRGIRRAAAFSLVLNQPSVNHFELFRAAYRGIPCQAVLKPL